MRVGFCLVGVVEGEPDVPRFQLFSEEGKNQNHLRAAFRRFRSSCNVLGLEHHMQGDSGVIQLRADDDQLTPEVVGDIYQHVVAALEQIK